MALPNISVVMSVRNGERHLRQSVDSILQQSVENMEIIIVDDGSTDRTRDILDSFQDSRIVRLHNNNSIGLAKSLNRGIEVARGRYIARMDDDDISLPGRFRQQLDFMDVHPNIAIVGSGVCFITEEGESLGKYLPPVGPDALKNDLMRVNTFVHGSVMMRSVCVRQAGLYRSVFEFAQDYDLWLRLAEKYDLSSLPMILYSCRIHVNSISVKKKCLQDSYALLARRCAQKRRNSQDENLSELWNELVYPVIALPSKPITMDILRDKRWSYIFQLFDINKLYVARQQLLILIKNKPFQLVAWLYILYTFLPPRFAKTFRSWIRRAKSIIG
jgi:glycosyltransferase involved in cell wall biosynthesis